ncbi:PrsW family intramembrane metalloprotease [Georgenia thermotolerans]|uniref:PrsW family intramembrane metalloprotease n=1 Tax=Georgenia thermotolerans TaxID=527326 RepID=A0A7J5ULQ1_9MICO|nr:PrsW family intramembrane metalloprotease [Georgenia thermotolerans]KAE8762823.1 PrsW family intramembrane metalloprotease [Georgenia thermotolerans]
MSGPYLPPPSGRVGRRVGPPPRPAAVAPEAQLPTRAQWGAVPRRHPATLAVEVVGIALGLVGALWVLATVLAVGGTGATALAGVLAFIPLVVVLATVRWVDRWEPEPRGLLAAALAWGIGVAAAVALFFNDLIAVSVYAVTGSPEQAQVFGTVVGAPVVEEIAKGAGVLLIFLLRRRAVDGPVDGIVYAAVVAAGFAFTENVLYFVQYQEALTQVFVARAIYAPFAHVTFTACTGIALGLASRRSTAAWVVLFPVGLAAAMALHALWNGSAVLGASDAVYWSIQVPLFVGLILLVLWLRADERRTIARRLGEYAQAGWFTPFEVTMLSSMPGRRRARAWAATRGPGAERAMRDFQAAATSLAYTRQRALSGRYDPRARRDEQELLERVVRSRAVVTGAGRV